MDWHDRDYRHLVEMIAALGNEIDVLGGMDADQEREFRRRYTHARTALFAEDFAVQHLVEAAREQVEIVRECLARVPASKLAEDTGLAEDQILLIAEMSESAPSAI